MMRAGRVAAIARFEFLGVVRRLSYLLATFGLPLFLALVSGSIFAVQTYVLLERAEQIATFGLVDAAGVVDHAQFERGEDGAELLHGFGADVRLYESYEAARGDLNSGAIQGLYLIDEDYLQTGEVRALRSDKTPLLSIPGATIEPALRLLLSRSLLGDRVDEKVAVRVLKPAEFVRTHLSEDGALVPSTAHNMQLLIRAAVPLFLGILLLTALLSASGYLVQAIATDKESKIVEVLLSSATPDEIVAGKLLGLGAAGFLQFTVWSSMVVAAAGWLSATFASAASIPWAAVLVAPIFFVLGYFFMGSLMLATAALGTNAAESQKLTLGWAILAMLPVMFLVILLDEPHGWLGQLLTWIPFTSPLTVIIRLALDPSGIPVWEIMGSLLVLLLSTWLSIRIGARLFRVSFALTGTRPSLSQLWKQGTRSPQIND
jgi:ABC-2 type transport system permease protein